MEYNRRVKGRGHRSGAAAAAVGDRAEDLALKEVMQTMDLQKRFERGNQLSAQYERLGIAKISPGSFFGGTIPEPPPSSSDQSVQPNARCRKVGKAVAKALFDKKAFTGRVASLRELDEEGSYVVAVRHGLFAGITCALRDEADLDMTRSNWENGICVSYMQIITTTVLRGERHRTDSGFGAIDEGRVVSYLHAESGGWQALVDAAVGVAHMVVRADFGGDERTQAAAHRAGRDSWTFFQLALVHRRVARLIFLGDPSEEAEAEAAAAAAATTAAATVTAAAATTAAATTAEDVSAQCDALLERAARLQLLTEVQVDAKTDAIARGELTEAALCSVLAPLVARAASKAAAATATRLAKAFKRAMKMMWEAPPGRDPGSVIEANMSQAAAMLSYWARELRVPVDFDAALDLGGTKRAMYRQMSQPMGEATIKKGRFLNQQETMTLLQPMGPPPGGGGSGGGGGGGGGGGAGNRPKGKNRQQR